MLYITLHLSNLPIFSNPKSAETKKSAKVSPTKEFFQFFADAIIGYNSAYTKREIALDFLGRKGKPYFVVKE